MGRSYIVEDAVEGYLCKLCEQQTSPVTGLLIGQSSTQRDFVLMATRTPQKEGSTAGTANCMDKEWVAEHARQCVSQPLPLVFVVEKLISTEHLWTPADDDVTDYVTLQINAKTKKYPFSTAKPADWKYQSGVCSNWTTELNKPFRTDLCHSLFQEELKVWAQQIKSGVCLTEGKRLPEDTELTAGQVVEIQQTLRGQHIERLTDVVQQCGGSVSVRGAIHSRAYLPSNKLKAKFAEKRDVVSTVSTRVQMLVEELLASEEEKHFCLPRRVFCPVKASSPVCVCDYQFSDEGLSEVTDRLKEMLDITAAEDDLDTRQEMTAEVIASDITAGGERLYVCNKFTVRFHCPDSFFLCCLGVAIATAVALLATAASMLYLTDM
uniref:Protein odr-4 homolog n=1 Tax=Monopterus albus TaxID=43700 RepID=A0A3Q3J0A5_MONAL